jgi:hypothetical protein
MAIGIGVVLGADVDGWVTKVEGNKVTIQQYEKGKMGAKGDKKGDPMTFEVAKDAKILKGTPMKKGKIEPGDAIEDGLKNEVFTKASEEKQVRVRLTTDDDKKVTQILVVLPKK